MENLIVRIFARKFQIPGVVVSTDQMKCPRSQEYGAETPFKRPSNLALDETGKFSVFKHAFENCKSFYKKIMSFS